MFGLLLISGMIFLAMGAVFTVLSFIVFDHILKRVKDQSEDTWITLGKPIGFFWVPSGQRSVWHGGNARSQIYSLWTSASEGDGCSKLMGPWSAKLIILGRLAATGFILGLLALAGSVAALLLGGG